MGNMHQGQSEARRGSNGSALWGAGNGMKISVITVVKNAAGTVLDTVASVKAQDYPDVEHIVIDGGSCDGTLELLIGPHAPSHLISEPDRGVYDGFNHGLAAATGDVIGFLNGDDVFDSSSVLSQLAAAMEKDALDAVYGDLVYVDRRDLSRVVRYWQAGEYAQRGVRLGWMPPHPTLYARRDFLQGVGQFDDTYRIAGDYEFFLRMAAVPGGRFGYLPSVMVRMRAGGMSNWPPVNHLRKWKEDLRAMRQHRVGGVRSLLAKNLRKIPQVFSRHRHSGTLPAYRSPVPSSRPAEMVAPRQPA